MKATREDRKIVKSGFIERYAPVSGVLIGAVLALNANSIEAQTPPLPPALSMSDSGTDMRMAVSDQRTIPVRRLRRVAVGDPGVVDVAPVSGGVILLAKKAGSTKVTIWQDGTAAPTIVTVRVRAALADPVLRGTGAEVATYGDTAVIDGDLDNAINHQAAVSVAQQSAAKTVDRSVVGPGGVVQVDVKIVEFSKSVLKQAGFNLFSNRSNGFGFGVFGANNLTSFTPGSSASFGSPVGTAMSSAFNLVAGPFGNGLFANLSVLEANNLARVLAEPTLVALSGQSASFLAGGEIPIPQAGGLGTTTVVFKSFGIGLTVTPTVLGPQRIALKVAPEASDLNYAQALTLNGVTVPSITTRRADTTVELGDGESFVIGGLVSRTTTSNVNKVPLLGDLPIIGAFFKTLQYEQDDKELVIVVTPHLVKPIAQGVAVPLPGEGNDSSKQPVWGAYLVGPALRRMDAPGFSR